MAKKKEQRKTDDVVSQSIAIHTPKTKERSKYSAKVDRKTYDDVSKRKKFKDKEFVEKKIINDPYTGDTLHKNTKSAKAKYKKNYNKHTAQTDHTVPIEKIVNRNRDNVFISDADIKEITNIEKNYKIINGNLNQSKGSKSNSKIAKDNKVSSEQKKRMIKEEVKATVAVEAETAKRTLKGAGKVGLNAAKKGATIGFAVSTVQNTKALIDGKKELPEAVFDVAVDTAKTGASSFATAIATKSVEGVVKSVGHEIGKKTSGKALEKIGERACKELVKFANGSGPAEIVVVVYEVGQSVKHYLDGELTEAEFIDELGEKGLSIALSFAGGAIGLECGAIVGGLIGGIVLSEIPVVGTIVGASFGAEVGGVVGELIGNMVGYMLGSAVYKGIQEYYKVCDRVEVRRTIKEYSSFAKKVRNYRRELERQFDELRMKNNAAVLDAFDGIREGILQDDADLITTSLDKISSIYGEEVRFKTSEQFIEFWNDPNSTMKI